LHTPDLCGGEIVDPEHPRRSGDLGFWAVAQQPQQGAAADVDGQPGGQPDPSPAGQRCADSVQQVLQRLGSPAAPYGQAGDLLDEGAGRAGMLYAVEAPDPQQDPHRQSANGPVREAPLVAVTHRRRQRGAGWAGHRLGADPREDVRGFGMVFHPFHRH
jgi:hypothetical protein